MTASFVRPHEVEVDACQRHAVRKMLISEAVLRPLPLIKMDVSIRRNRVEVGQTMGAQQALFGPD
jgi:hypothetical protein